MRRPTYCTIATAAALPQALLLRDSIRRHQGDVDFRVLLVEMPRVVAQLRGSHRDVDLLGPNEIDCPRWLEMAFCYEAPAYVAALQPFFLRALLRSGDVIYFDPDVEVLAPLGEIEAALGEADVLVTPYLHEAGASLAGRSGPGTAPGMMDVLRAGPFCLGFLALRGGEGAEGPPLLALLGELLAEHGAVDGWPTAAALWAAQLPVLARRLRVLRSPRFHLAPWNAFQRPLSFDAAGAPLTTEGPLAFCHHAGLAGAHAPRWPEGLFVTDAPGFQRLFDAYRQRIDGSPHARLREVPGSFGIYVDGVPIPPGHRRAFLRLGAPGRQRVANPFVERAMLEKLWAYSPALLKEEADHRLQRGYAELQGRLSGFHNDILGRASTSLIQALTRTPERARLLARASTGYHRLKQLIAEG